MVACGIFYVKKGTRKAALEFVPVTQRTAVAFPQKSESPMAYQIPQTTNGGLWYFFM